MQRLINTLYVTTEGAYVHRDGDTIHVRIENETRLQLPIHTISGIVCIGNVVCSAPAMGLCAEKGVAVSFLSMHGRFRARVQGPVNGNVLLRRQQYRWADDPERCAKIARSIVAAKVANCRTLLARTARDHPNDERREALRAANTAMAKLLAELDKPQPLDTIRGREGDAARHYFGVLPHCIVTQRQGFPFSGRNRRPPRDAVNALLSFLYTLLVHDIESACETVGLDPCVGFLHRDRPGRPSLALDLMEELRPVLADRLALTLINRQQIRPSGFTTTDGGGVIMDDKTRKTVLVAYQERKAETIHHPLLDETIPWGMVPFAQVQLLARHIRGDLDEYPAYFWR